MEAEVTRSVFFWLSALWGVASIALLISAVRLCYRIEARSGRPLLKHGLPGYANVIPVALNVRVAQDEETQAMRWRMNKRLIAIVAGFALLHLFRWAGAV
jgi:hypothetical protein